MVVLGGQELELVLTGVDVLEAYLGTIRAEHVDELAVELDVVMADTHPVRCPGEAAVDLEVRDVDGERDVVAVHDGGGLR